MNISRFNAKGKQRFIKFLDDVKSEPSTKMPVDLLEASDCIEQIGGESSWLDELDLSDRLSAAEGLDSIVSQLQLESAERDWGFWSWCSAYLFDRLCRRVKGAKKPGETSIWIPEPQNYQRYYRHYLASIWQVYSAHKFRPEPIVVLLNGPVNKPGELWGQIAASQKLITNNRLMEAIHRMFWDAEKNERRRGAGGGIARRLPKVLKQLDKTFDFFAMSADQIVELLPPEFDRFKPSEKAG